jgi:hypothetical protein
VPAVLCKCGSRLTHNLRVGTLRVPNENDAATVDEGTFAIDPAAVTVGVWERGMPKGTFAERETDPAGAIVVNPADRIAGALDEVDGRNSGCCGLDGCDGPNQRCVACSTIVATARTDCWTAKEVRFLPSETVLR